MSYTPYLISNYSTGYDKELQPWLLPDDAYTELLDGYVYRGVTEIRDGYSGFATGLGVYTESRMVHGVINVAPSSGIIDGANKTFGWTLTTPVSRGSITINGSNPVQVLTDDGIEFFTGDGTGTIDYTTGAVSITFTTAPIALSTVLLTYSYYPGYPVMGIMNFYPTNNIRQLLVADTRYVNKYDPSTNRLVDIPAGTYTGTNKDFWSWVNYEDASFAPRLLFCNGVKGDVIQQYDGSTIVDYNPTFGTTLNAKQMFNYKDRLVLFYTIEGINEFPRRIRISGTGTSCDDFSLLATGAGYIDIPDNTHIFGAAFNRDDLLFFTESSVWALKYTGNDVTPFSLQKIDASRGSAARFSVIGYLNRTMAASPRGLILCDGYQVDRMDNNIPDFAFEDIDGGNFEQCFSGFFDEDRDVYLLYPSKGVIKPPIAPEDGSDRILVTNFEEDNYSIYRLPLSTVGNFQSAFTLLWSDLTAAKGFPNWDAFAVNIGNWNAFPFTKSVPISIGGGHKGEVWKLNDAESEDNPQKIRDISVINNKTIRVTTDWNNYNVGDYIAFEKVGGMIEINDKQGQIINPLVTDYTTFDVSFGQDHGGFTPYTSGGQVSRVIPFEAQTKKLNPWINTDKKLKCGWIYFYVSVSGTNLTDWDEDATPIRAELRIDVLTNDNEGQDFSDPQFTYLVDCSPINNERGGKKWVKIWINQVGKFLQFKMSNTQSGANIKVHAMMCGFQAVGRLI